MNNTDKLLRAFIEASGYEIETKITIQELHNPYDSSIERMPDIYDYKVTTTKAQVCFDVNGPEWSCIVDFVLAHREDIINDVNDYGGLGVMLDYFNRDS